MENYQDFTSLAPEEEQAFVVYEQTSVSTLKKGSRLGMIVGTIVFVLIVGIRIVGGTHEEKKTEKPAATTGANQTTPVKGQ